MKRQLHLGLWLAIGWVPLLIGTTVAAAPQTWKLHRCEPGLVMAACTVLAIAVLLWPQRPSEAVAPADVAGHRDRATPGWWSWPRSSRIGRENDGDE